MEEAAWPAGEHDVDRVVELAARLHAELAGERGGGVWLAADAALLDADAVRRRLADPSWHVLVGGIDGTVLGFAAAHVVELRDRSCLGIIDELFVESGAREVGVGEELLEAIVRWCGERNCRGIDASALPGQRATKNFFEGNGFVARRLVMHHPLVDE